MSPAQPRLFDAPVAEPEGFRYRPEVIAPDEESELASQVSALPFKPFEFHGHLGLRQVVSFGWKYDYGDRRIRRIEDIPGFLLPLRSRAADLAGLRPEELVQLLINQYAPGAPIGWHRDKPQFGKVVGVSLLSPSPMRFRRRRGSGWERVTVRLEPRSAYLLDGPSRDEWEHSLPPAERLRFSITFRSLRPNESSVQA